MKELSLIQIENQAIQLAGLLEGSESKGRKRFGFFGFFKMLSGQTGVERFHSYYIQFAPYLPIVMDNILEGWYSPETWRDWGDIVQAFTDLLEKHQSQSLISTVVAGELLAWLNVGEPDKALRLIQSQAEIPFTSGQSRAEIYKKILENITNKYIYDKVSAQLEQWAPDGKCFFDDQILCLLVENGGSNYREGTIRPLRARLSIRPRDAEQHTVFLNNKVPANDGSFYYSLLDGVHVAHSLADIQNTNMNRYFAVHYSLPDKDAGYSGDSIGLAAAMLAQVQMINHNYGKAVCRISGAIAVTGSISHDGRIKRVDNEGLIAKLQAAFFSLINQVVVPYENLTVAVKVINNLNKQYPHRQLIVQGYDYIKQVLDDRNLVDRQPITVSTKIRGRIHRLPKLYTALFSALSLILITLFVVLYILGKLTITGEPDHYGIVGNQFTMYDHKEQPIWSYGFGMELTERFYLPQYNKNIRIIDLNGDGHKECLIGIYENSFPEISGNLYCFSYHGKLMWKRHLGRRISIGGNIYEDHFRVSQVFPHDFDSDGKSELFVASHHYPWFPAYFALLDCDGNIISEYWHMGQITSVNFIDINHDGTDEIFVGGLSNEYKCAVFMVFDFQHMAGCSPHREGGHFSPDSVGPGTEMYYVRIPQSAFTIVGGSDNVCSMMDNGGSIKVEISNGYPRTRWGMTGHPRLMFYKFNDHLQRIAPVSIGDMLLDFMRRNINNELNDKDLVPLEKILYWDGASWSQSPVINAQYLDIK